MIKKIFCTSPFRRYGKRPPVILYLFIVLAGLMLGTTAQAGKSEIRMYKMTHDGHVAKFLLFGKADDPGCHNLPYTYKVYKVAVIGFASCSLFAEKDCSEESLLTAYWKGKNKPATKLKQGTRWRMTRDDSEVGVRSWSCVAR